MTPTASILRKHSTDNLQALDLYLSVSMDKFNADNMVEGTHYVELDTVPNLEAKFFDNKRVTGYLNFTRFLKGDQGVEIKEGDVAVFRKEILVQGCEWHKK
jgi:hypothetical protein